MPLSIIILWLLFAGAFLTAGRIVPVGQTVVSAPRARWGIALQAIAMFMVSFRAPGKPPAPETWLAVPAVSIGCVSVLCAFFARRRLGKQWRVQAGLLTDHELITDGPYSIVRHPIYAAMLGMFLMTGLILTKGPILAAAAVLFLAGIEVRIRAEDRLLEDRFGEFFRAYKSRVRAYLPFIR